MLEKCQCMIVFSILLGRSLLSFFLVLKGFFLVTLKSKFSKFVWHTNLSDASLCVFFVHVRFFACLDKRNGRVLCSKLESNIL